MRHPGPRSTRRRDRRAEAALQEAVGANKVLRLDTDSVNSPDKLQQQLARVRSGEPLVILGTQIISKGMTSRASI